MRLYARFRDEVPADVLETYRLAGATAYELADEVETRLLELRIEGRTLWTAPPAARVERLCAWNALVLQTLGTALLDADYARHPATAGYVPQPTAAQALAWFAEVEPWVTRARQARANPGYRVDTFLPAALPPWIGGPGKVPAHLDALLRALEVLRGHAAAAMGALPAGALGDASQQNLNHIRQLHAAAEAGARHAGELARGRPGHEVRFRAEAHARAAVEDLHVLGQWVAEPSLARAVRRRPEPVRPRRRRLGRASLLEVALEPGKDLDARRQAVFLAGLDGRTPVGELIALYDQVEEAGIKDMVIFCLDGRPEPAAVDRLAELAQLEPNPDLRRVAKFWLRHSSHARAVELRRHLSG
jgi:hypothetical protein